MSALHPALAAGLAVFTLAAAPAIAQRADLPHEVQTVLRELRQSCSGEPGSTRANAMQSADLNGDGRPDYVVDFGAVDCPGGAPTFCGSGGCRIDAVVSIPGGYRASDLGVLGAAPRIVRGRGLPILRIPSRGGSFDLRWNGRTLTNVR